MTLLTICISNYMRKATKKNIVFFIGSAATGIHYHEKCEAAEEAEGKEAVVELL